MKTDLLQFTENGGCSAKISPTQLQKVLDKLPIPTDKNILVNTDTSDDAGVYKINDDLALIITTDFFPPLCSDAYEFGQIAASNAISDVYAMGGKPIIALNIMMFPADKLPMEDYTAILNGGYNIAKEAGVSIIGGHTIDDESPKYGLAVVGTINPNRIIANSNAQTGDVLILTKPIGMGAIMAGHREGIASDKALKIAIEYMKQLNKNAAELMQKYNVKCATDITGFGLAGHGLKIAQASGKCLEFDANKIPLIEEAYNVYDSACIPGAAFRNLEYIEKDIDFNNIDYNIKMLSCDAQSSGGILMCVNPKDAESILSELKIEHPNAAIIGRVKNKEENSLLFV